MAAKTYFLDPDNGAGVSGLTYTGLTEVDTGAEATAASGWTVAKVAPTVYDSYQAGAKRASTFFSATVQPSATPNPGSSDVMVSPLLTGTFDAGVWTSTFKVIAVGSGGDQDGNMRFKIWKADATFSVFTQLTAAAVDCGTVTNLAVGTAQTSSAATPSIGPFTLSNECILLQPAWKLTGAGGATTRDVVFRKGTGITLVTPNFTVAAATKAPPFQARTARNSLLRR